MSWLHGRGQRAQQIARHALVRGGVALALVVLLLSGYVTQFAQAGIGAVPTAYAAGASQQPTNTFNPANVTDKGKRHGYLPGQTHTVTTPPTPDSIHRPAAITMQPVTLALDPAKDAHFVSSDKRLEVTVPAGALTSNTVLVAGGAVSLQVTELAGPSGGSDSGHVSLGTYQFTLVGPHGPLTLARGLAKPIQLTLHLNGWRGAAFNLNHVELVILSTTTVTTTSTDAHGKPTTTSTVVATPKSAPSYAPATLNAQAQTLTASLILPAGSGGGAATWNTDSPQAQWSKQQDTSDDPSSGTLSYDYPLDLPTGQGGLTPKLDLTYNSGSVASAHNPQGTSGWLGEGWDLSVGSISWGEHNVTATCTIFNCQQGQQATWENSWSFSDAFGNGGDLIPQNSNVSPWYDDTTFPLSSEPLNWYLAPENRVRIVSYTNPNSDPDFPPQYYPTQPPCFRAFLPNGYIEEFGCVRNALVYYVNANGGSPNYKANYIARWNLDLIIDPNGNQIQFNYSTIRIQSKANNALFNLDTELSSIAYDASACHSRTTMCSGASWNPAVQILFNTAYAPTRLVGSACPTWTNTIDYVGSQTMRCDDVQDLSTQNPAGDAAPTLQSLLLLNDIQVQVTTNPGSNPTWNTLRDYQLSYEQAPSTTTYNGATIVDPVNGQHESVAGYTDLVKIQEVGDDGSTSLPPLTMSYQTIDEFYTDPSNPNTLMATPVPTTNCGPSWNKGQSGTCAMWSQTYNLRYLSTLDNGRGWHETYSWALARNNTHGVNSGLTLEDPLACTNASLTVQSSYPCDEADDENWSRVVLTQRTASVLCVAANGTGCGSNNTNTLSSTTSLTYALTDAVAKECNDCTVDMYWGDQNDGDYLDFYNTQFMGFHLANVVNPDGSLTVYTYNSTMGYGLATSSITCKSPRACYVAPWTDPRNVLHGRPAEQDDYDTNGTTQLKKTVYQYNVTCQPNGDPTSAYNTDPANQYIGQLTSELDPNNPIAVCEIQPKQTDTYIEDGGSQANSNHTTVSDSDSYDGHGHLTQSSQTTTANNTGSMQILDRTQYVWDDAISANGTSATGTYFNDVPAIKTTEDGSGNVKACTYEAYDGGSSGVTGQQSSLTKGLLTRSDAYSSNCTPGSLSGQVSSATAYDTNGNTLATEDADALAGLSGHTDGTDCTINGTAYSACAQFDSLYTALPTQVTNALRQKTQLNYTSDGGNTNSPDATNGWGTWLTTSTDANGNATSFGYDALGRLTTTVAPGFGDSAANPTTSYSYSVTCAVTGAQEPCTALLTTKRLGSGGASAPTVTSATYYDGWGRAVETVTPSSQGSNTCTFVVQYTSYDAAGHVSFKSVPYFVTLTQGNCAPSYQRPDTTQAGSTTTYDGLDRVLTSTDNLKHTTTTSYSEAQPQGANVNDVSWYEATTVVDASSHQHISLADGFGHTRYAETFTGNSQSSYALYGVTASTYDWLGNVTKVTGPALTGSAGLSTSALSTVTYDLLGRKTASTDADLGAYSYGYDPNGNLTSSVDPRGGTAGSVYIGYDGLNRALWRNSSNSQTGAYVTYTYDTLSGGTNEVGRLAKESFNSGSSFGVGSYTYSYDARGEKVAWTTTLDNTPYLFTATYNDDGTPATLQYSDTTSLAYTYNPQGWLSAAATGSTNLYTNITYTDTGGAAMKPNGASLANGTYTFSQSYDADLRPSVTLIQLTSSNAKLYRSETTYGNVGNVSTVKTVLAAGTDNQSFCYDEQNRLIWASATGVTTPCNNKLAVGTLTSAEYTATFNYDPQNRLTSGPAGSSYTYGDSAHLDAATSTAGGYSASYDAAGDLVCRAPTSGTTCAGTQTGAQLSYDNERRLIHWQNAPTSPTTTADYRYDGEGNRVAMQVTTSGTTTTTYYVGNLEEQAGSTLTKYYSVPGLPTAMNVGGTFSYLASDSLSSVSEALDSNGNVTAQQLFLPYGGARYTSGTMPTSKGFTGQRGDAATGLDYYNARYYDPTLGQFASADSKADGINRYAYVKGNPETFADPTGHLITCPGGCGGGNGGGVSPCQVNPSACGHKPTPPPTCQTDPHLSGCTPPTVPPSKKPTPPPTASVSGNPPFGTPGPETVALLMMDASDGRGQLQSIIDQLMSLQQSLQGIVDKLPTFLSIIDPLNNAINAINAAVWELQAIQSLYSWQEGWSAHQWSLASINNFGSSLTALTASVGVGLDFAAPILAAIGTNPLLIAAGWNGATYAAILGYANVRAAEVVAGTTLEEDGDFLNG